MNYSVCVQKGVSVLVVFLALCIFTHNNSPTCNLT